MSIKNKILAGAFSLFFLTGGLAGADEIIPNPTPIEQTLEKKVSKPKISINFNLESESLQKSVEGITSQTRYSRIYKELYPSINLNDTEKIQVENILRDIQDRNLNSYQDFIRTTENLSENQKLVLAAAIGNLLGKFNYKLSNAKVMPQDDFFFEFQDSLVLGDENGIGCCRHISSNRGKFLNDIGIRTAVVTGNEGTHAYNISKIKNGTAIIDYGKILIADTKNIEKVLESYEGDDTFQHLFFNNDKFKYRLITKNGKNFLKFIEYDETSGKLKDSLIQENNSDCSDLTLTFNKEDYLTSAELNCFGFFAKAGEIRGDSSSAMDKMQLFQAGYKNNFLILDTINLNPSMSFVLFGSGLVGITGDLTVSTNNKEGFNLASRVAGNLSWTEDCPSTPFHDLVIEAGVSYKIPINNSIGIEPYLIGQLALFPKDLGVWDYTFIPNEIRAGTAFDMQMPNDLSFSLEPYYLRRIWEQGGGANVKVGTKYFGLNLEGFISKSDYAFCPDKYNLGIGLYFSPIEDLIMKLNYKKKGTNYEEEIEDQSFFNLYMNINLN